MDNLKNIKKYIIPIGTDNFRRLITLTDANGKRSLFVDKTKFIQEIINDGAEIILITRPRRFGKTMNMSMLQHFLAKEVDGKPTKDLFDNLLITKDSASMAYKGKHPVIFISFKEIKDLNFRSAKARIAELIRELYSEFRYVIDGLAKDEKEIFFKILYSQANDIELQTAIKNLSKYIYADSGVKPYILIDEYDTPIQTGYDKGYYADIIDLLKGMFSACLKGNPNIEKGVLTGITRIARESIFSDLNNTTINSLLDEPYSQHFGFTESEVDELFLKTNIEVDKEQIRVWYNGYTCGNTTVYNPWSIMNCIKYLGKTKPYWINTSSNELAIKLIINGGVEIHERLAVLLQGKTIIENIDEHVLYTDIEQNRAAIWTLLLMTGYLKIVTVLDEDKCELAIPNKEVRNFYKKGIQNWLAAKNGAAWYQNFLEDLLSGNMTNFEKKLTKIVQVTFSIRDIDSNEPERVYHAFMIGLLASLQDMYDITSNQESGLGYYDFLIIPKERHKYAIVLEFKAPKDAIQLEREAKDALQQIKNRKYSMQIEQQGIKNILLVGIAFTKKEVKIIYEKS